MNTSLARQSVLAPGSIHQSSGFTLIEVLVSLIILSVGLLGLGLLQSQSLKASFSSNHRTQATNLAYQLLDEMRANKLVAYRYSYIAIGDFAGINPLTCDQQPATSDVVGDDIKGWECQVKKDLPLNTGTDGAVITFGGSGVVTINIAWTDQRFSNANDQSNSFTLSTTL